MHDAGALLSILTLIQWLSTALIIVPKLLLPHQGAPDRVDWAACLSKNSLNQHDTPSHVIFGQLKVQSLPRLAASLPRLVVYPFRPSPQSLSQVSRCWWLCRLSRQGLKDSSQMAQLNTSVSFQHCRRRSCNLDLASGCIFYPPTSSWPSAAAVTRRITLAYSLHQHWTSLFSVQISVETVWLNWEKHKKSESPDIIRFYP